MAEIKISELQPGDANVAAEVPANQSGVTKRVSLPTNSAAFRAAGAAAGNVPVLDAQGQLETSDLPPIPPSALAASNSPADTQVYKYDAASSSGVWADSAGGNLTIPDDSIGLEKLETADIATEAEVLEPDPERPKLVTNVGINDKLEEFERTLGGFWSAWTSAVNTNITTIPGSGTLAIEGFGNVIYRNTSGFNVRTSSDTELSAGGIMLAGTSCAGMPSLSSGTLRGILLWLDGDGTRWAAPIDNPEGPDSEEFFKAGDGSWEAVAFDSDELQTSVNALPDNNRFYPITTRAHDKPAGNFFQANCGIAKRNGGNVDYIYPDFSTSVNRFILATSMRDFMVPVPAGSLTPDRLLATNTPSSGQYYTAGATPGAAGTWATPSSGGGGGGGTLTRDTLWTGSVTSGTQTLTTGKSFASHDRIVVYYRPSNNVSQLFSAIASGPAFRNAEGLTWDNNGTDVAMKGRIANGNMQIQYESTTSFSVTGFNQTILRVIGESY